MENYLEGVKKEKRTWPVNYHDFFPYVEGWHQPFWNGYFSSRPGFKKESKDYSALYHAQSKMFARRMID
jgi:hypothetical protein